MQPQAPVHRDVVLVGGGHSHALVVRSWPSRRVPGVRITLISDGIYTPYSGMLPGWVAGHYDFGDVHIDLPRLCQWAGVRFVDARMTALDMPTRTLSVSESRMPGSSDVQRPPIGFDVLSLDTGSTPSLDVPGAAEHAVPVKPVHAFDARWQALRERVHNASSAVRLGVVGSGAGGFELLLAMQHALGRGKLQLHWFLRGSQAISERPDAVGERALAAAMRVGVQIHRGFDVIRVQADGVEARDDRFVALDEVLWCTAAAAPDWPAEAGLATDERGFVATNAHLQSLSHPSVFAAGDVGTQLATPSPKAGVYAVRQAPVLGQNLCRFLLGEPLRRYTPQHTFLSLMALGGKRGIASRPPLTFEGAWVWRWKNQIDQRFMQRFRDLPRMPELARVTPVPQALHERDSHGIRLDPAAMRCNGCGAKVGQGVLMEALQALPEPVEGSFEGHAPYAPTLSSCEIGVRGTSDVATLQLASHTLVQSVDQLRAMLDDPYLFARIATLHALSDAWTERVKPHSVQVLVNLPQATEAVTQRELSAVLAGVIAELAAHDVDLVGGHTAEGAELSLGLVVNASPVAKNTTAHAPKEGAALVLTQPLGIGVLLAGHAAGQVRAEHWQQTIQAMLQANASASQCLFDQGALRITDVTGFGLLAHAENLVADLPWRIRWQRGAVPFLSGAWQAAERGIQSSLLEHNRRILRTIDADPPLSDTESRLWCDPQTGGGLLAVMPADRVSRCVQALHEQGYPQAAQVGVLAGQSRSSIEGRPPNRPGEPAPKPAGAIHWEDVSNP